MNKCIHRSPPKRKFSDTDAHMHILKKDKLCSSRRTMLSFFHQLLHAGRGLRIVADSRSALKWSLWTLYWLPVGVVVNQYLFAFKIVTGRSMQVCLISLAFKPPCFYYGGSRQIANFEPRIVHMAGRCGLRPLLDSYDASIL